MQIGFLADHQDFIPLLARWHFDEWGYMRPDDTLAARTARLRAACGRHQIPSVFVAHEGSELLGSAMLVIHDMDTRLDLTPWLAGVFVRPDRRGTGIGAALVGRAVEEARALGVTRLHLYTIKAESLYARLGWCVSERTSYRGEKVTIMATVP